MTKRIHLILLYGGKSSEHEVSLRSAASVFANLDRTRYQVTPIAIDKEGKYYIHREESLRSMTESLPVHADDAQLSNNLIHNGRFALAADVVFPVLHGPLYEDGALQGLLALSDIAFVGCGVLSSALGMDKDMSRRLVAQEGIASTKYRLLNWSNDKELVLSFADEAIQALKWPMFVKPCTLGSSIGIHKVYQREALLKAIDDARRYDTQVLVEEGIKGHEYEVAVLESQQSGQPPRVSLPGEIRMKQAGDFYSYINKYLEEDKSQLFAPANLDISLQSRLQAAAAHIFTTLKCEGMARVDFFVDDQQNNIYFNEINTLPGFTSISMYPKLWQVSGMPYHQLLDELIQLALRRYKDRQRLVTHYR